MILVCLKWVALRPVVDPLTGETITDARWSGVSGADQAALELALRIGALRNITVQALTVGETESEAALRDALAAGASTATRIDAPSGVTSETVAAHIEARTNGACARIHPAECALCQAACASFVRADAQRLVTAPRRTAAPGTLVVRSHATDAGGAGEFRPRAPPATS